MESKLLEAQSRRDAALQQKLVADSKLNKATINQQSMRQNVTRLQQKMAQIAIGDNPFVLQLKLQQDIKKQQIAELKSNLTNAENQIQLGQKAADAHAISSKQWDELTQKRTNIQTQISTATTEIQGIDAQIAQAKERTQEELLNQRLPEANDKMKEVGVDLKK